MLESFFNKAADLKACNSIKKRLQHNCFPVKFAKFLRTPFFKEFQSLLLRFQLMFSKEFGVKTGATVSNIYQTQLKKDYLLPRKARSSHCKCSVKEGLQELSTLTVSPCVTRFHCLSHGIMVGSSFLTVLQILGGFSLKDTIS